MKALQMLSDIRACVENEPATGPWYAVRHSRAQFAILPDPADGRSSRIMLTEVAEARLPDAVAVLLQGNREVLCGFTEEETGLLVALLTRLIAKLDQIAGIEASPRMPLS